MKGEKYSFIKIIVLTVKMQFKAVPGHMIVFLLLAFLEALGLTIRVAAMQRLFDVIAIAAEGKRDFTDCIMPLFVLVVVTCVQQIMNGMKFFHWNVIVDKSAGINNKKLFEKIQNYSAEQFEDAFFLDSLNKAKEGIKPLTVTSLFIMNLIFFDGVYIVSMGAYLFNLKPVLPLTLLLAFIPAFLSQVFRIKGFAKLEEQSAPLRREYDYYKKILNDRQYIKETRTLGAFVYFFKLFNDTLIKLTNKQWEIEKKIVVREQLLNSVTYIGMGISTYLLFVATISGEISVGAFAAIFAALTQIFDIMQTIMTWDISGINKDIGKVTNLIKIYDSAELSGLSGTHDFSKGIIAKNVGFIYPGRNEMALANVSVTIRDGEFIAIVGENGSGKSTLVKILTGLYRPSVGTAIIGELDSEVIAPRYIYNEISGVFQDYQRYKMTLAENVSISEIGIGMDELRIKSTLMDVGINTKYNEINLNTVLSPEFGGIDLSGGQWQRLAIARGLYRHYKFIVLDEPTAAIDPIEENMIYTQFKKLTKRKCAVVITHRLGTAKLADRIVVMDNGRIVDTGTHEELLSRSGKYKDMWNAQSIWYKREDIKY